MLHPSLTILFVFMILASFLEVNGGGDKKNNRFLLWIAGVGLIVLGGLRSWVGADYPVYKSMYEYWFQIIPMQDVIDKLLFRESTQDIEPLYILLNQWVFAFGAPFYILTLVIAIIITGIKMFSYSKNSPYPVFSLLLIFIPVFFTTDSGQMRQGIAMAICYLSYEFIKRRSLGWFLFTMYIAFGFHKSVVIFVPVYWLATIPLNSRKIAILIVLSVITSPLKLYALVPNLVDALTPQDVVAGYTGYIEYVDQASTFMDATMLMYATFIITYDKEACRKVLYYEYVRNIVVIGICLYFVFRSNPVFATRLIGMYTTFSAILIPCIVSALPGIQRRLVHIYFVIFMVFYYFVFASYQGLAGRWTSDTYQNMLW